MSGERPEKPVRLQSAAKLEALDAFNWYEERNPDVADRFAEQLRETFSRIASRPQLYPRYPGQPLVQFVELKSFPYLVIYRDLEDEVEVIAVVHARRQPLYWNSRLKSEDD
jgi:toxin ParE1/3/4